LRIEARIVGLTAIFARMPGRAPPPDLDQPFLDLRHFQLEQAHQETARCAEDQPRALGRSIFIT
jgi:hypothetical protein